MQFLRFSVNLFIALMIAVMGIAVWQDLVVEPISFYYDTEITYTSYDYSYKPGQSGTEYFFFKVEGENTTELNVLQLLMIPAFFYWFFITAIGLFRRIAIPVKFTLFEINKSVDVKLFRKKEKSELAFHNYIGSLVALFIAGFFFAAAHWDWFTI